MKQYENTVFSGSYNVGPDDCDCITTAKLVVDFCREWNENAMKHNLNSLTWKDVSEKDAPHEASFLKLDCSKIKNIFGWSPRWHMDKAIQNTVEWYKVWMCGGDIRSEMDREIENYGEVI